MLGTLADFWSWPATAPATTAPEPKPRPGPVFIGDILMSRGGEPELLRNWRDDASRANDP